MTQPNQYYIGIDLGTTNSCVAVFEGKNAKVINSQEGSKTVPSIISYKGGEKSVGALAKRQAVTNPKNTLYSTKRFIGRSYDESKEDISMVPYTVEKDAKGNPVFIINGKQVRPEEAAAEILTKMKGVAQEYLGKDRIITGAVITVPAYFNNTQKNSTIDAGEIAGFDRDKIRIINEPTAAALAYGFNKKEEASHNVAVFDFGGGTFDVSILEISNGVIEVKATYGDNHLGGDDIDNILINHVIDNFKTETGVDIKKDPMALQRVKDAAENAKKELSESISSEIILPFITMSEAGPQHLNATITRNQFNELISGVIQRLVDPCNKAIEASGLSKSEIHTVLAVGGSTRIPAVKEKAEEIFGKPLNTTRDQDTVVAEGAAIQAGVLAGDVTDVVLLDTLPIAIGLETEGGIFTPIIKEGVTIPTSEEQTFTTAIDNQTSVTIRVLQGDSNLAIRNQEIGRFDLSDIAPAPRGVPQIKVKFSINSNGVLNCSAKDVATNKETSKTITAQSGLSKEIVEELKAKAEQHRAEDEKKASLIHAKHEAESSIKSARESLKNYSDKISEEIKQEIEKEVSILEGMYKDSESAEEIKSNIEKLTQAIQKIGEAVYANQGGQQPQQPGNDQNPSNDEVV